MPKLDIAETRACFQSVVCAATLMSEGCTLPEAVLQCTVAGNRASSKSLILTLQKHEPAFSLLSAQQY